MIAGLVRETSMARQLLLGVAAGRDFQVRGVTASSG